MTQRTAALPASAGRGGSAVRPFVRWAVKIAGLGAYVPPRRVDSAELENQLSLSPGWVEQTTGVRERRRSSGQTAVAMAALAARDALERAGAAPGDVDLLIGASVSRQQLIPCTAVFVQRELGLPEGRSFCFDLDATCLSFLAALHMAAPLLNVVNVAPSTALASPGPLAVSTAAAAPSPNRASVSGSSESNMREVNSLL